MRTAGTAEPEERRTPRTSAIMQLILELPTSSAVTTRTPEDTPGLSEEECG